MVYQAKIGPEFGKRENNPVLTSACIGHALFWFCDVSEMIHLLCPSNN